MTIRRLIPSACGIAALALALTAALPAAAQTTTLGTRASPAEPNPPLTANADATWSSYYRPIQYPNVYQYPLQFITLDDGRKLGVLVSVPADWFWFPIKKTFPVVLTQTAYRIDLGNFIGNLLPGGSTLLIGGKDQAMIKRGYVTVAVDVLGSGVSDGMQDPLSAEEQLPYGQVVDWILEQPWSNGNIGVAGTSYLGITALMTAVQEKSAIKAVFAEVPMGDAYRDTVATGGMPNSLFLSEWLPLTQQLSVYNDSAMALYPQYAEQIASATQQHVDSIDANYLPLLTGMLAGEPGLATDDGDYWASRSVIEQVHRIDVPTFIIGSSQDIFQRGEPLLYERIKRNALAKLVILPGTHVGAVAESLLGSSGLPPAPEMLLRWFDQYLKGIDTDADALPTVTQVVAGHRAWWEPVATASDWPHPQMRAQRLYLHGNEVSLSELPPSPDEAAHTVSEFPAPVVTLGKSADGTLLEMTHVSNDGSDCSPSHLIWTLGLAAILDPRSCYYDSNVVEQAQGAINFETPPLDEDLYLNGPMQANIWIASTAAEAALSVRVDDVAPDGTATPISNGLLSAAYRAVDDSRSRYVDGVMIQPWHPFTVASRLPVVPGEAMELPVEIFPAAALIRAGHRLRVSISASNQAQGIWPAPAQALAAGGVTTILADATHPSHVVLPVVPTSALE